MKKIRVTVKLITRVDVNVEVTEGLANNLAIGKVGTDALYSLTNSQIIDGIGDIPYEEFEVEEYEFL